MQPFPHHYDVRVSAQPARAAHVASPGLSSLNSEPPIEFDGPGNLWSPETLLVAAVADCLVLTFRSIANARKFKWDNLVCDATGTLDRADGVARFTAIRLRARLSLPSGADAAEARVILERAEKACLVGNSLKCKPSLETELVIEEPIEAGVGN